MESFNIEWLNDICTNCFGIVKDNILRTGKMEIILNNKRNNALKITAQVKCANPENDAWSWPVETNFF